VPHRLFPCCRIADSRQDGISFWEWPEAHSRGGLNLTTSLLALTCHQVRSCHCSPPGQLLPSPVANPSAIRIQVTQTKSCLAVFDQKSVYTTKPGGEGFGFAFRKREVSFRFKLGKPCGYCRSFGANWNPAGEGYPIRGGQFQGDCEPIEPHPGPLACP